MSIYYKYNNINKYNELYDYVDNIIIKNNGKLILTFYKVY